MYQTIINAIVPVLLTAITGVLVAVIKAVGDAGISYVNTKIAAVKAKAGQDKWNHWLSLAKEAWNIVDEEFRITPTLEKTIAAKQAEFEVQIKKLIPEITDAEIDEVRQAVAGEINKGREAIQGQTTDEQGNLSIAQPAANSATQSTSIPSTVAQPTVQA